MTLAKIAVYSLTTVITLALTTLGLFTAYVTWLIHPVAFAGGILTLVSCAVFSATAIMAASAFTATSKNEETPLPNEPSLGDYLLKDPANILVGCTFLLAVLWGGYFVFLSLFLPLFAFLFTLGCSLIFLTLGFAITRDYFKGEVLSWKETCREIHQYHYFRTLGI